jgi:hypothetical protein
LTNLEAKQALARKLDIDYSTIASNDVFSDTDLQDFIQAAVLAAWDYKPWPFSRKAKTVTTIDDDYYDNPEEIQLGSITRLTVGGKSFRKLDFEDYQQILADDPNSTKRIWADWETYIFVNKNAYTVGDPMDWFGKKLAPALSGDSDLLPFSPQSDNYEHSGNHAIVKLAYANALQSEKLNNPVKAAAERKNAYADLDQVWQPFADTKANAQRSASMFDVSDMFATRGSSKTTIGNFDLN